MEPPAETAAYDLVRNALLSPHSRIKHLLQTLPVLQKGQVELNEPCPICFMPFSAFFDEEGSQDTELGLGTVTKLVGCGHVFCRKDLAEWIRSQHGSCPTCRHTFLDIRPPSDSDDESSDGGEYIPPDELEEDDDPSFDFDASFTDTDADVDDFAPDEMELDLDTGSDFDGPPLADVEMEEEFGPNEADINSEYGLTDGESEWVSSDGDLTMDDPTRAYLETELNVSVHEDSANEENENLDTLDFASQESK